MNDITRADREHAAMPYPRSLSRFGPAILIGCAAALAFLPAVPAAETGKEIVTARQDAMKRMADAAKTISAMFQGRQPFDGNRLRAAARSLATHSGAALAGLFPDPTVGEGFAATEAVSARREEFEAIASRLNGLATEFERDVAGATAITPAMRMRPDDAMGGGSLLGSRRLPAREERGSVPAEHVFHEMLGTCTECHWIFRRSP